MRVMLEQARLLARDLAYHRRARLEAAIGRALDEVDGQIEEFGPAAGARAAYSSPLRPRSDGAGTQGGVRPWLGHLSVFRT